MSDKRVEKNKQNVENIKNLLLSVCEDESGFLEDENLFKALSSQGGLAKYKNENFGVYESSLNTIKRTAERLYPNGFEEINNLRILALKKINNSKGVESSKKNTKEYYKKKYEKAQNEVETQREVNLVAIHQLMDEIQILKNLKQLEDINLIHDMCNKQIEKLQSSALYYSDFAVLKKEPDLRLVKGDKDE